MHQMAPRGRRRPPVPAGLARQSARTISPTRHNKRPLTFPGGMTIIMVTMPAPGPYKLLYAPVVREHLRAIHRNHHSLIKAEIEASLRYRPDLPAANRKLLSQKLPLDVEWELRCGPGNCFRVFYNVDALGRTVEILAIGVKRGSRLTIGREEVKL